MARAWRVAMNTRNSMPDFTQRDTATDGAVAKVFELFPHGIMLLDGERHVLRLNEAGKAILGDQITGKPVEELTCCELFGCRTAGGPLEGVCLTEMALGASSSLPEMRIDLPAGGAAGAVWVSAARFPSDSAQVLLELRPGDRRDRRRRSSASWAPPTQLSVFTLGRTLVTSPEGTLSGRWLSQRPGQVLKYLVCERRRTVSVEEITEALWPGGDQRRVNNVRYLIYTLRSQLEPDRGKRQPSRFILAEPGGYRLNPEAVDVDADEFEHLVRTGVSHLARGDEARAGEMLRSALTLYAGDFLADERYAMWAFAERDRLRELASEGLSALVKIDRRAGDLNAVAAHLDRLADMHPFDADIHRQVIELAIEQGRHTIATRRYSALRRRLLEEFGQAPSFDLSEIAAGLGSDQPDEG